MLGYILRRHASLEIFNAHAPGSLVPTAHAWSHKILMRIFLVIWYLHGKFGIKENLMGMFSYLLRRQCILEILNAHVPGALVPTAQAWNHKILNVHIFGNLVPTR